MAKKISIIIPVFNESANLMALYEALKPLVDNGLTRETYDWEVIMIDDGSKDDSYRQMMSLHEKDSRYKAVAFSRNFGKEAAMLAGMDLSEGDAVVIMDADLQHPVGAVPAMIDLWEEGYDDIYGRRRSRSTDSALRRFFSRLYYKVLQSVSKSEILPEAGDFRLLSRRCVQSIRRLRESQRYTKNLFSWVGYKKTYVLCDYSERHGGKSSFSMKNLFNFAIEGITSNTTAPLRMATWAGAIAVVASLIYLVVALAVSAFSAVVFLILFIGGTQLVALGIIGEYLSRIFNETKQRPLYIIDSVNGEPLDE